MGFYDSLQSGMFLNNSPDIVWMFSAFLLVERPPQFEPKPIILAILNLLLNQIPCFYTVAEH